MFSASYLHLSQREQNAGFDLTQAFLSTPADVLVSIMETTVKRCGTHAALTAQSFLSLCYKTHNVFCFISIIVCFFFRL